MSEIFPSQGASDQESDSQELPQPEPQPYSQTIPQPRQHGDPPRAASIYDESEPVVRQEVAERREQAPVVTGNAPPARKAIPPAGSQQSQRPTPARPAATTPDPAQSNTLRAANQLRVAARGAAEAAQANARAQAAKTQAVAQAQATAIREAAAVDPVQPQQQPQPEPAVQTAAAPAPAATAAPLSDSAQKVEEWKEIAEATWADASVILKDIQRESEVYIRANPTRAALTALGIGFVLGVVLKR